MAGKCLTRCAAAAVIIAVLCTVTVSKDPVRGEAADIRGSAADWTILGLDVPDYANKAGLKVAAEERQWIRHYKLEIRWKRVQPSEGEWQWSYYDNQFRAILSDGARSILLTLGGPVPEWARDSRYGSLADKAPPQDLGDWYGFCSAVAERYGTAVDFYEIWNEPGWDRDSEAYQGFGIYHFGGQVETDYLPLLQLGYAAIKERDPTASVMCGALMYSLKDDPDLGTENYTLLFDEVNRPGQDVSLKVEADRPIVAERPMYFNYQGAWTGGHDVVGAAAAGREWYFAEGTTRAGFDEWLCMQNPNPDPIQVTATFMFGPGQGPNLTQTYTLDATSRTTFKVNDLVGPDRDVSVQLASASDFIAERPMYFDYQGAWTGGHDVVGAGGASPTWYFAEGCTGSSMQEYLCLQNPHAEGVRATLTFILTGGGAFKRTVYLAPDSRTTLDINMIIGFHGSCDMVGVHPYKSPWYWGAFYTNIVKVLRAKGVTQEVVTSEIGWPHYSSFYPGVFSETGQAAAVGEEGVKRLFDAGCRKIWLFKDIDDDPADPRNVDFFGLFSFSGQPHPAWSIYVQWQQQLPDYPVLPPAAWSEE